MPRPVSRWRSAARPSWWRPAVSIRTSRWCSSSIRLSGTIRSWKDRGPARREAGTNSFARRVAISRTWTNWFYVYATPDYRDPAQRRGLVFRLVPGNIWVNQQGRRFPGALGRQLRDPRADGTEPALCLGNHGYADDRNHGGRRSLLPRRRQGFAGEGG